MATIQDRSCETLDEDELDKQLADLQAKKAQMEEEEKKQQEFLKAQEVTLRKKQKAEELLRLQQDMNLVLSRVEDVQAHLVMVSSELEKSPKKEPAPTVPTTTPVTTPAPTPSHGRIYTSLQMVWSSRSPGPRRCRIRTTLSPQQLLRYRVRFLIR